MTEAGTTAKNTRVSILIPVYNEELHVREVLEELKSKARMHGVEFEFIIVDDGSTDATSDILAGYENDDTIQVHTHERNFGKGAAIREGLKRATGDVVLIQDADLEYFIDDYPKLLLPIISGEADVVYGSRFLGDIRGMKLPNLIFNKLICWMVNILFFTRITDEATAYKIMRTDIARSLNLKSTRFEICPEITAKVLKRGYKIHEVPIRYRGRDKSQGKKIRWTDAVDAIVTLLRFRFTD